MQFLNNDLDYDGHWENELLITTGDLRSNEITGPTKCPAISNTAKKIEAVDKSASKKKQIINVPPIFNG